MSSINRTTFGIETTSVRVFTGTGSSYQSNHFWNWNSIYHSYWLMESQTINRTTFGIETTNLSTAEYIRSELSIEPLLELKLSYKLIFSRQWLLSIEPLLELKLGFLIWPIWVVLTLSIEPLLELKLENTSLRFRDRLLSIEPLLELKHIHILVKIFRTVLSIEPLLELKRENLSDKRTDRFDYQSNHFWNWNPVNQPLPMP